MIELNKSRKMLAIDAAEQGKALTSCVRLLRDTVNNFALRRLKRLEYERPIYLNKKAGSLLVYSDRRAYYEERAVKRLASFFLGGAFVPFHSRPTLEPKRSAFALREKHGRLFLGDPATKVFLLYLPPSDSLVRTLLESLRVESYELLGSSISFAELISSYLREEFDGNTVINGKRLEEHFLEKTGLAKALEERSCPERRRFSYLYHNLSEENWFLFQNYHYQQWKVLLQRNEKVCSFSELIALFKAGLVDETTRLGIADGKALKSLSYYPGLESCLAATWSLDCISLDHLVYSAYSMARQYVPDFLKIADFKLYGGRPQPRYSEGVLELLLSKLDKKSFLRALLTLDLQFCDLHGDNFGIRVASLPQAYEDLLEEKFFVGYICYNLTQLLCEYFSQRLSGREICLSDGTDLDLSTLKLIADQARFELVFFDLDLTLAESNTVLNHGTIHVLACRSDLLASRFAEQALAEEVLEELESWNDVYEEVFDFMSIPQAMRLVYKQEELEKMYQILEPILEQYSFSNKLLKDMSLETLKKQFFLLLKETPSPSLNALIQLGNTKGEDPEAFYEKTLKKLFPAYTKGQVDAYKERIASKKAYLACFKAYRQVDLNDEEAFFTLVKSLIKDFHLFDLAKERLLLRELELVKSLEQRSLFMRKYESLFRPSFWNIAKAEYPLLASNDYLLRAKYRFLDLSYRVEIGLYQSPLESLIDSLKPNNSPAVRDTIAKFERELEKTSSLNA